MDRGRAETGDTQGQGHPGTEDTGDTHGCPRTSGDQGHLGTRDIQGRPGTRDTWCQQTGDIPGAGTPGDEGDPVTPRDWDAWGHLGTPGNAQNHLPGQGVPFSRGQEMGSAWHQGWEDSPRDGGQGRGTGDMQDPLGLSRPRSRPRSSAPASWRRSVGSP